MGEVVSLEEVLDTKADPRILVVFVFFQDHVDSISADPLQGHQSGLAQAGWHED